MKSNKSLVLFKIEEPAIKRGHLHFHFCLLRDRKIIFPHLKNKTNNKNKMLVDPALCISLENYLA